MGVDGDYAGAMAPHGRKPNLEGHDSLKKVKRTEHWSLPLMSL